MQVRPTVLTRPVQYRCRAAGSAMLIAAALVLAACSSSSTTSPSASGSGTSCSGVSGPIKVGNIVPLSGPLAAGGLPSSQPVQAAVAYFNQHNSICGQKVALTNLNDQGDPSMSVSDARQLVSSGVEMVFNASIGNADELTYPYLMKNKVFIMTQTSQEIFQNVKNYPYYFNMAPTNDMYAQNMINWAKSHGYNDIGTIGDTTAFGDNLAAAVKQEAPAAGLKFIKSIDYSPTAIDVTAQLKELEDAGVKTLFDVAYENLSVFMGDLKDLGWNPHLVGYGGLHLALGEQNKPPASAVDACIYSYAPGDASTELTPTVKALLNTYVKSYGNNASAYNTITFYNALLVLKHGIETARTLDPEKVKAAIEATKDLPSVWPGLNLSFSPTSNVGYPQSAMTECLMTSIGPYSLFYRAS
jgi:branched-chain amino acid transport system substrate-binding protein